MDYILTNWFFAVTYGSGGFGDCTYQNGCAATTTTTSSGGGTLVNTGVVLTAVATAACLLIFAALFVRFAKRRSAHYVKNR